MEHSGVSATIIKSLIDKQIFQELFLESSRLKVSEESNEAASNLNEEQHQALEEIRGGFLKEQITFTDIIGFLVTTVGVFIATRDKKNG